MVSVLEEKGSCLNGKKLFHSCLSMNPGDWMEYVAIMDLLDPVVCRQR